MMMRCVTILGFLLGCAGAACAHDAWLQTNTRLVHAGDVVHVDLMFGNHGNEHRDFKLAGKAKLEGSTLSVLGPEGEPIDLLPKLIDLGYAAEEGYWSARFVTSKPGVYLAAHTSDKVVAYAPTRSIKSAKVLFMADKSLDKPDAAAKGFDRVLGHALELVPVTNPVLPMGPGQTIAVKLLFKGKPLAGMKVSFIPRGVALAEGTDPKYERETDEQGVAKFKPEQGTHHLIVAHHATDESGEKHTSTKYSATLSVQVPQVCPCCAE